MTTNSYASMRAGYGAMWKRASIHSERRAAAIQVGRRALAQRERYAKAASVAPGMPWWWVAAAHSLESGASFTRHLHNGDPLTARTRQVPAGRPASGSPPFTWEVSARDALTMHALDKVPSWEIERCLYEWERYNGFGYTKRGVNSPYVWSFTTLQQPGKYVADGVWSATAVSQQCGAAAIAKAVAELEQPATSPSFTSTEALPASGKTVPEWDIVGWIITQLKRVIS